MTVKKIRYLLEERGRFYYQRKVPKALTHAMKMDRWHLPVGSDYETATDRVKELKKEHDALIKQVKADPSYLINLRREGEVRLKSKQAAKARPFQEFMDSVRSGEIECYEAQVELAFQDALAAEAEPGWKTTKDVLHDLQELRKLHVDLDFGKTRKKGAGPVSLEEYQAAAACYAGIAPLEYFEKWQNLLVGSETGFEFREVAPITDDEFSDRLSEHLSDNFSAASAPTDEDERLEFDILKMKLERLIARFSPTPDKLSSVFERFLTFSNIKTEPKYRRVFKQFVRFAGDIPISQVTTTTLREYRDELLAKGLELASVKAAFTPLKSLFRYAQNEEIIDTNPTLAVSFRRETRPVQETRKLPFEPAEVRQILSTIDEYWLKPAPNLRDERRIAIRHIARALAFTGARPIELACLKPEDVSETAINIRRTKTQSSWRFIPVHPEISDFPAFVRSGGIDGIFTNEQDPAEPVRYNFMRLIREVMDPPILEPRKALYSFRGTFQDALRRAGAPLEIRQAILGHTQGGAIKHYDSGPEFEIMQEWVFKADPRL